MEDKDWEQVTLNVESLLQSDGSKGIDSTLNEMICQLL